MTLLSCSDVGFDIPDSEKRVYFKFIKEAFEDLDEIAEVSAVLKLVARSKFIRVVFDFRRESVGNLDALTSNKARGTSYFKSGHVYLGAKGLLEQQTKFEVLGTLAHELTHYAMQLVYENNCRPYSEYDQERTLEFQTVSLLSEFHKTEEPKIFYVFNYPEDQHHAELIVRVPHLLAMYKCDEISRDHCTDVFKELFEFFRTKTLVDLENELPLMLAKRETFELNAWLGVIQPLLDSSITLKAELLNVDVDASKEILLVLTNCVKLTVKAIHQQLERDLKSRVQNFYLFARPSTIESENLRTSVGKTLNLPTKPTIVFECDDDAPLDQLLTVVNALKATERVIFVTKNLSDNRFDEAKFRIVNVKHIWEDFIPSAQNELWKYKVNFQGEQLDLCEVMKFPSGAIANIPFCDLLGHRLKISYPLRFSDIDFYVERKFVTQSGQELNFDLLRSNQIVLVADDPGAGKTTTFKMLSEQLKKKFPLSWVGYVDLKQFIDSYEEAKDRNSLSVVDISTFFAEEFFNLGKFDSEIFKQLFTDDRVILLLDGIDEICPNYKAFIQLLLKTIKNSTNNQLWISTRPHLAKELSFELAEEVFHLKPFSPREQRNFYVDFYGHKGVPSDSIDRYVDGIEKLMNFLSKNRLFWSTITNDIVSNPLFMRIAAEIYNDDIMQSSKNGKCLTLCNLFLMYERFIEKKFSVWIHKGRLSLTDQLVIHRGSESITRCHLRIALEKIFNESKVSALIEDTNLTKEQIVRVGLTTHNGLELQFVHRTFAEFFVADFIFKEIFCREHFPSRKSRSRREKRTIMRLFVRVLSSPEFQMIRAFLGNAFELVKHKQDPKRFAKLAFLFKRSSIRLERDQMLSVAVEDGCVNLTSLILKFSVANKCALITMMNKKERNLENVLVNAIKLHRANVETIKNLWEVSKPVYDAKIIKKVLLSASVDGESLFCVLAASSEPKLLQFYLEETKLICHEDEFRDFLADKSAFEMTLKCNKNENFVRIVWSFYNEVFDVQSLRELLQQIISPAFTSFRIIMENEVKVFREFWKILQENFYEAELKKLLLDDLDGRTILHQIAECPLNENVLKQFLSLLEETLTSEELQRLVLSGIDVNLETVDRNLVDFMNDFVDIRHH